MDNCDHLGEPIELRTIHIIGQAVSTRSVQLIPDLHHFDSALDMALLVLLQHYSHLPSVFIRRDVLLEVLQEDDVDDQHPPVATQHDVLPIRLQVLPVLVEGSPNRGLDLRVHGAGLSHFLGALGFLEDQDVYGVDEVGDVVAGLALLFQVLVVVCFVFLSESVDVVIQDVLQFLELLI